MKNLHKLRHALNQNISHWIIVLSKNEQGENMTVLIIFICLYHYLNSTITRTVPLQGLYHYKDCTITRTLKNLLWLTFQSLKPTDLLWLTFRPVNQGKLLYYAIIRHVQLLDACNYRHLNPSSLLWLTLKPTSLLWLTLRHVNLG